ncbi:hypothetical protein [Geomesophilobacter sediminis]|uniref:Uncharacterized protein n=1 Tax=Geomesophilobacter sediminis TaxID=2798584 RepID=A0A8J7M294_9BACT|nr:hypothetical protein [Geomesophilobacter sediminis]MBJ6727179.1 hypothetical protein [Geomesophilobacter sediminis]
MVSITAAPSNAYNCNNDPVEVRFTFTPTDPAQSNSLTDNNVTLTVGDGINPPRDYITAKGFTVGSTHTCVRKNIVSGACAPVGFEFPTSDFSDYGAACY